METPNTKTAEEGYAIKGIYGFYSGWHKLKKDMINQHCQELGQTWMYCRKKGDRAVKIIIKELPSPPKQ